MGLLVNRDYMLFRNYDQTKKKRYLNVGLWIEDFIVEQE